MPLITLFSAPKPFTDPHIAMIQRNAIHSWSVLPEVEIILLGREAGLAQAAQEFGAQHIPEVVCNESGTPRVSSMFQLARQHSRSRLLCVLNADILLMPDFLQAAKQAVGLKEQFVLLSQRWDLEVTDALEFQPGWQARLRSAVQEQGRLHRPAGSDFFLFPKSLYPDVPDFAIGRAGWDNWMIYEARREKWPVIDLTPSVMIVHQNHDYRHLPGGRSHYEHPDTHENIRLAGGAARIRYTILDATDRLADGKLARPKMSALRFQRDLELFLRRAFFFLPEDQMENVVRPRRWKRRLQKLWRWGRKGS